jgi:hypothetical protein
MTLTDKFTAANGSVVLLNASYIGTMVLAEPQRSCDTPWSRKCEASALHCS